MQVIIGPSPDTMPNSDANIVYLTQDPKASPHWVQVPSGNDLLAVAGMICIAGPIHLPGSHVLLKALQLAAVADNEGRPAAIIVDGAAGASASPVTYAVPSPAQNGTDAGWVYGGANDATPGSDGAPGSDGTSGTSGGNADSITIFADGLQVGLSLALSANGGDGGDGQDGGPGQAGGNGGKGIHGHGVVSDADACLPGADGGNGGSGGAAGRGGNGGAGGTVQVTCVSAQPAGVTLSANGGAAGKSGNPGAGASGGTGGAGSSSGPNVPVPCSAPGGNHGSAGRTGAAASPSYPGGAGSAAWTVVAALQSPLVTST